MTQGKHECTKPKTSPTYSEQWSGVSYAPHARGRYCPDCYTNVHNEDGNYYCPRCDDYVRPVSKSSS